MLKSILLHLENSTQAAPVIKMGVRLAREAKARVRGLTMVDTRAEAAAMNCESALYLSLSQSQQSSTERLHEQAHSELARACLHAKLNFDVRRTAGDPTAVLPAESQFHDLTITSVAEGGESVQAATFSRRDLLRLFQGGVRPLMILPARAREISRVLLVYDGSPEAVRAIGTFWKLGVLRKADYRLLAIGNSECEAKARLTEMAEFCATYCRKLETGYVVGRAGRVVRLYSQKWESDLLVMGLSSRPGWLPGPFGRPSVDFANELGCGVLLQG